MDIENLDLLKKLALLPTKIKYKLPVIASGADEDYSVPIPTQTIWGRKEGEYEFAIFKTLDGRWEACYVHYNLYEGYPEVFLPARTDEEIIKEIKKEYGIESGDEETDIRWMISSEAIFAGTADEKLEKSVDKVIEWLRKEGFLD